jgi:hypothetical protein
MSVCRQGLTVHRAVARRICRRMAVRRHWAAATTPQSQVRKTASFLSAFPMFFPSLSWQNDRFLINGSKMPFLGRNWCYPRVNSSSCTNKARKDNASLFLRCHFIVKNAHLPRQARDKHTRERALKTEMMRFRTVSCVRIVRQRRPSVQGQWEHGRRPDA